MQKEIEIFEGANVEKKERKIIIKGEKGELWRELPESIDFSIEGRKIILKSKGEKRKDRKIICTFVAHLKNMLKGVTKGFVYKLQVCSVHFPISVSVANKYLSIKNFLGEEKERKAFFVGDVDVKIEGDIITVSSADKEAAGQTAANIEAATKIRAKDRRIFQDGIYIISKPK